MKFSGYPLSGIYVPNLVPFDEKGRIREPELRRMVRWLADKGVHGLYPNGSTGEFIRMSFEERLRVLEIIMDEVGDEVPVLAGATEGNLELTIRACERYHELGCVAASVTGPYYYKVSEDGIETFFRELARESPIDILAYNIPQFANEISVRTLRVLAEQCPRIIGVKDSSRDFPRLMTLINTIKSIRSDFTIFVGTEEMVLPTLMMGADGGTIATCGVVPEAILSLYSRFQEGNWKEARRIQFQILNLIESMFAAGNFPDGFRLAVELRGFAMGLPRQPLSGPGKSKLDKVRNEMACLLAECGARESEHLCGRTTEAKPSPSLDSLMVDRIVSEVMQKFQKDPTK
jgi:4-hydroxy-tetrahydrodipicolinate synthase